MVNASDIITYIGVPLAVLGVMPMMYTFTKAILTKNRIRREIKKNHIAEAITRTSLMSGVVEVEIPRYSIHPLTRDDSFYWSKSETQSLVPGGSWTMINWQKIKTGKIKYHLQLRDKVRQPQAEIEFDLLVSYLLDRGAVPNAEGVRLLKTMGLQTPKATPILVSPGGVRRAILSVSTPDESEGHLSLHLYWADELEHRDANSLPPYWARLEVPSTEEKVKNAVRLYIGEEGCEEVIFEGQTRDEVDFRHIEKQMWFACICITTSSDHKGLWRYALPKDVVTFSCKESIPAGVLMFLGLMEEVETPLSLARQRVRQDAKNAERHAEFLREASEMAQERKLPTEQARQVAARERGMRKSQSMLYNMQAEQRTRREDDLDRKQNSLTSPRVSQKIVADSCLKYLLDKKLVKADSTMQEVADTVLYDMIFDVELYDKITKVLNHWKSWCEIGLMNDQHLDEIQTDLESFCYAGLFVFIISERASIENFAGSDLAECQRAWRTVYLG